MLKFYISEPHSRHDNRLYELGQPMPPEVATNFLCESDAINGASSITITNDCPFTGFTFHADYTGETIRLNIVVNGKFMKPTDLAALTIQELDCLMGDGVLPYMLTPESIIIDICPDFVLIVIDEPDDMPHQAALFVDPAPQPTSAAIFYFPAGDVIPALFIEIRLQAQRLPDTMAA